MIRKLSAVLIITFAVLSSAGCKKKKKVTGIVTIDDLKVRNKISGGVIAELRYKQEVEILARSVKKYKIGQWENYWYKIKLKSGTIGWSFAQWIRIKRPGENTQRAGESENVKYKYYLYVTNFKGNSISFYSINKNGTLKNTGRIKALREPIDIAAHPRKNFVYALDKTRVVMYNIGNGGRLVPVGTTKIGAGGWAIHVHPNGRYVYVTSSNPMINISIYRVQSDGRLKPKGNVFTFKAPRNFTFNTSGEYVYFYDVHKGTKVMSYRVKTNGKLENLEEVPVTAKTQGVIKMHPHGKLLYVSDWRSSSIVVFDVKDDGKIVKKGVVSNVVMPRDISFGPEGKYVFITLSRSSKVAVYKISSEKLLEKIGEYETGKKPKYSVVHPNGKFLYVLNGLDKSVSIFKILNNGKLEKVGTAVTGIQPSGITIGRMK